MQVIHMPHLSPEEESSNTRPLLAVWLKTAWKQIQQWLVVCWAAFYQKLLRVLNSSAKDSFFPIIYNSMWKKESFDVLWPITGGALK